MLLLLIVFLSLTAVPALQDAALVISIDFILIAWFDGATYAYDEGIDGYPLFA